MLGLDNAGKTTILKKFNGEVRQIDKWIYQKLDLTPNYHVLYLSETGSWLK